MECAHSSLQATLEKLGWPAASAASLADGAHTVNYERGALIFHAGESADLLYVLLSGEVKLYFESKDGDRLLVDINRAGHILGFVDIEAGDDCQREATQLFTAQALSRCRIAVIAKARFARELLALPQPLIVKMMGQVNAAWAAFCQRFLIFLTMSVRSRLAYTIADIATKFGIDDARGKLITLKLSHEDFGELVGASRPMVSKHLKELGKAGVFSKQNGRYVLSSEEALWTLRQPSPASTVPALQERKTAAKLLKLRTGPQRAPSRPRMAGLRRQVGN